MQTEILRRARGRPKGEQLLSLSDEELHCFRQETKRNRTTRLQFDLMLFLGLRVSELVELRRSDVLLSVITVQGKKGGLKKVYDLPVSLSKQLRGHVRTLPKKSLWLFPGMKPGDHITKLALQFLFNRLRDRAGLSKRYSIDCLRHTTAMRIVRGGGGPVEVQDWMRLKNLTVTMRYFSINANSDDIQERKTGQISYQKNPAGNVLRGVNEWI